MVFKYGNKTKWRLVQRTIFCYTNSLTFALFFNHPISLSLNNYHDWSRSITACLYNRPIGISCSLPELKDRYTPKFYLTRRCMIGAPA